MAAFIPRRLQSSRGTSRAWHPASETKWSIEASTTAWSPNPTPVARLGKWGKVPDETCAYYSDKNAGPAFGCSGAFYCAAEPMINVIGCCTIDVMISTCAIATTCIEIPDSDPRRHKRDDDPLALTCTENSKPYCLKYTFAENDITYSGYSAFACGIIRTTWTVTQGSPGITDDTATTSTTDDSTTTSSHESTSRATSSLVSSHASSLVSSSNLGLPTNSSVPETDSDNDLPTGTIAGSIVGGVAGTALILVGIVFLVLRSRKKKKEQAENSAAAESSPTLAGGGQDKGAVPLTTTSANKGTTQPLVGQSSGTSSDPISPASQHTPSGGVTDTFPASPMQDDTTGTRTGQETAAAAAANSGGRTYSIHNRPPAWRYHAYNPVSGGPVELPASHVHEIE